jgi:hypothetical protein
MDILLWYDISKTDLQCLGIASLLIAGKYEEIYPPDLKLFCELLTKW